MRQSFIIGAIMLWVIINIIGNIADQQALLGVTDSETGLTGIETLDTIMKPQLTDTNVITFAKNVGTFIITLGKTFTLWHPALWQGSAFYVYLCLFLPLGASFWVVILLALRGTGSG